MELRLGQAFLKAEYEDTISEMTLDQLNEELDSLKEALSDAEAEYDTNHKMLDRFADDPGMEHLLDMSIQSTPRIYDLGILKEKISLVEQEIETREVSSSDECEACKI